jgi:hypothetical protein
MPWPPCSVQCSTPQHHPLPTWSPSCGPTAARSRPPVHADGHRCRRRQARVPAPAGVQRSAGSYGEMCTHYARGLGRAGQTVECHAGIGRRCCGRELQRRSLAARVPLGAAGFNPSSCRRRPTMGRGSRGVSGSRRYSPAAAPDQPAHHRRGRSACIARRGQSPAQSVPRSKSFALAPETRGSRGRLEQGIGSSSPVGDFSARSM